MRVTCGFGRGCSAESIRSFVNKPANSWKQVYEGTVPLFTDVHKKNRMRYARDYLRKGNTRWRDHFDVDEKWFYAYCTGQRCKVPPGHNRPKKPLHSKSHIPKCMFLAVTALPRPEKGFDGKIGFFRVSEMVTAKRTSKYHQRGDQYEKDVTMNAAKYLEMMTQKVLQEDVVGNKFALPARWGVAPHRQTKRQEAEYRRGEQGETQESRNHSVYAASAKPRH